MAVGQVVDADVEMVGNPCSFPVEIVSDIPAEIIGHAIIVRMGIVIAGREVRVILVRRGHPRHKGGIGARFQGLIVP